MDTLGIGWCRGFEVWLKNGAWNGKIKRVLGVSLFLQSCTFHAGKGSECGCWMVVGVSFLLSFLLIFVSVFHFSMYCLLPLVCCTATAAWQCNGFTDGIGGKTCVGARSGRLRWLAWSGRVWAGRRMGGQGWRGGWFIRLRSIARESWWSHGPRSRDITSYCFTVSAAYSTDGLPGCF